MLVKKILIWFMLMVLSVPKLALAQENAVVCQQGDTFEAMFALTPDSECPDGIMGQLEYDNEVFMPVSPDITMRRNKDGSMNAVVFMHGQTITVSFQVNRYAPDGLYTIGIKVMEAAYADGRKTDQVKITPVQIRIGSAPTQPPTPTPSPTPAPKPSQTPTLTYSLTPTLTPTPEITMDIVELETDSRGQLNLRVRWSGGKEPYELSCYHYFNDAFNTGIEKCFEKVIDYGGNNVKKAGSHTTTTFLGARIIRLMPGQRYWIVLKDSSGQELWKEYECSIENYSDVTITCTNASFAKFQIPWEKLPGGGYGYSPDKITVKSLNSLKASSVEKYEKNNMNTENKEFDYGIIAKYTISGNSENDYIARYAIILPNGDEYSNNPIKSNGTTITIRDQQLFSQLLSIYNEIPSGNYTIILEVNGLILKRELILN